MESQSAAMPTLSTVSSRPTIIIVVGMAGSGKTTFLTRLYRTLENDGYYINLDPACKTLPFPAQIDIRDTVNYQKVMQDYDLGPNGAIVTSLNLFSTKIDQVLGILERRCDDAASNFKYIVVDTPGQIEAFTWSASGSMITEAFSSSFPTIMTFVADTPRCANPSTFMSTMLYSCSMMYRSRVPMVVAFNKTDLVDCTAIKSWMDDYEAFQVALDEAESRGGAGGGCYYDSLNRSMALCLDNYYKTLPSCGVSSATGDGVDEFFKLVADGRKEYLEVYWQDREKRRNELHGPEGDKRKEEMERFDRDTQQDQEVSDDKEAAVAGKGEVVK